MAKINGHVLTDAEESTLNGLQDWLFANGGDSCTNSSYSPAGDGRWVPLTEIFPRYQDGSRKGGSKSNAQRQTVRRLHKKGVLQSYEIAYYGGCVKAAPFEKVAGIEEEASQKGGA